MNQLILLLLEQLWMHPLPVRKTIARAGKRLWTGHAFKWSLSCVLINVEFQVLSPFELFLAVGAHLCGVILLFFGIEFGSGR